jgi:hypothetical protein
MICLGGVGVDASVSIEHTQRDKRIEEVPRGAGMQAETISKRIGIQRISSKLGKKAKLDGAK